MDDRIAPAACTVKGVSAAGSRTETEKQKSPRTSDFPGVYEASGQEEISDSTVIVLKIINV